MQQHQPVQSKQPGVSGTPAPTMQRSASKHKHDPAHLVQIGALKLQLDALREDLKRTRAQLASRREREEEAEKQLAALTERYRVQAVENERFRTTISEYNQRTINAERARKDAEADTQAEKVKAQQLARQHQDEHDQHSKLVAEVAAAREQIVGEKARAEVLKAELAAVVRQKLDAQEKLTAQHQEIRTIGGEGGIKQLGETIDQLTIENQQLRESMAPLHDRLKQLEQQEYDALRQVHVLQLAERRLKQLLDIEQERTKRMQTEKGARLANAEKRQARLEETVSEQMQSLEEGQRLRTEMHEKLQAAEEEITSLRGLFTAAKEAAATAEQLREADASLLASLKKENRLLKQRFFKQRNGIAGAGSRKDAAGGGEHVSRLKRAMAGLVTSRQEEVDRGMAEKQRRRKADDAAKALRARVAYLTAKVEDSVDAQLDWQDKFEVAKAMLEQRDAECRELRCELLSQEYETEAEAAEALTLPPPTAGEVAATLQGHVSDWLSSGGPSELEAGKRTRRENRVPARSAPVAPFESVFAPTNRTGAGPLVWQLVCEDMKGGELLQQFQLRNFLAMLQGATAVAGLPLWQGRGPAILCDKLAAMLTAYRQRDEEAAAQVGEARQAAALAHAAAVRTQQASVHVAKAVLAERAAKHRALLKYVQTLLSHSDFVCREADARVQPTDEEAEGEGGHAVTFFLTEVGEAGGEVPMFSSATHKAAWATERPLPTAEERASTVDSRAGLAVRLVESGVDDEVCFSVVSLLCGKAVCALPGSAAATVALAGQAPYEHRITRLSLRGNTVTDVSCRALSKLVARSRSLVHLDLRENHVGPRGRDRLVDAALANPSLVDVHLQDQDQPYSSVVVATRPPPPRRGKNRQRHGAGSGAATPSGPTAGVVDSLLQLDGTTDDPQPELDQLLHHADDSAAQAAVEFVIDLRDNTPLATADPAQALINDDRHSETRRRVGLGARAGGRARPRTAEPTRREHRVDWSTSTAPVRRRSAAVRRARTSSTERKRRGNTVATPAPAVAAAAAPPETTVLGTTLASTEALSPTAVVDGGKSVGSLLDSRIQAMATEFADAAAAAAASSPKRGRLRASAATRVRPRPASGAARVSDLSELEKALQVENERLAAHLLDAPLSPGMTRQAVKVGRSRGHGNFFSSRGLGDSWEEADLDVAVVDTRPQKGGVRAKTRSGGGKKKRRARVGTSRLLR